jgi:hypothetical protein
LRHFLFVVRPAILSKITSVVIDKYRTLGPNREFIHRARVRRSYCGVHHNFPLKDFALFQPL